MDIGRRHSRERLVAAAVATMRDMIVAREPNTQIGSLPELAKMLGVGIVTVQQAARVLEHEGFLEVRRGPGGGYYGVRPDAEALGRAISGFLLVRRSLHPEAIDIITLLDCELMAAAARCADERLRGELALLKESIDGCDDAPERNIFETRMLDILYRMVDRPLMEVLSRMAMRHYADHPEGPVYAGEEGRQRWKRERHRITAAILDRDAERARFEAQRRRKDIMKRLAPHTADESLFAD
ncbi:MAG: GntR family transcriptional regulator [Sphingobium sp.]